MRLKEMMANVEEAYEESPDTKETLQELGKDSDKDVGDDPAADSSGGQMGIKESTPSERVRGNSLMVQLCKLVDFYLGNEVLDDGTSDDDGLNW